MHPMISQAIAAERSRNMEQDAAAGRRAREIRRSRRTRGPRPLLRVVARMAETNG
jgi:hypothetical protein